MRLVRVALVTTMGVAFALPASADDLETARRQVEALDYRGARATLEQALLGGGNGPAELIELYRLRGEIAAALGDSAAAEEAFRRLLVLRPDARLPAGTAPKIEDRFRAAALSLPAGARLRVRHELATGAAPRVTLVVESDPLDLVARLRVTWRVPGGPADAREQAGDTLAVPLPAAPRLELTLSALDAHGNRVATIGSDDAPLVVVAAGGAEDGSGAAGAPAGRSLVRRWPLWGGLAVAFAGAGVLFALQVEASEDELDTIAAESGMHTFAEAQAEIERGRRMAVFANVSFVLAAGCGAAAAWFLFDERRDRPRLVPAPLPGGATLAVEGRF
jgi:hypothetical protein